MEPPKPLGFFDFSALIADTTDLPSRQESRILAEQIDGMAPLSPPLTIDFPSLAANIEAVESIDLSMPGPIIGGSLTPIRRCKASADLSSEVQVACEHSKRESLTLDEILVHLRANDFASAIRLYHLLTMDTFKKTAFNVIANKLFRDEKIAEYFRELTKNISADKRDEKFFLLASEDIALITNLAQKILNPVQQNDEAKYNERYDALQPLINKAINNTIAIYTELNNDSLRCALLLKLYTFIFTFPEMPIPTFPVQQYIDSGIRTLDALKEMRREHEVTVAGIVNNYKNFENKTISMLKHKIETHLLKFHLTEERPEALRTFFKNTCSPQYRANFLMFAALELISKQKINHLSFVIQGIFEVREQYSTEDKPKVESMIVQAILLATKMGQRDLAEQFFTLVPHKKEEILTLLAQG